MNIEQKKQTLANESIEVLGSVGNLAVNTTTEALKVGVKTVSVLSNAFGKGLKSLNEKRKEQKENKGQKDNKKSEEQD